MCDRDGPASDKRLTSKRQSSKVRFSLDETPPTSPSANRLEPDATVLGKGAPARKEVTVDMGLLSVHHVYEGFAGALSRGTKLLLMDSSSPDCSATLRGCETSDGLDMFVILRTTCAGPVSYALLLELQGEDGVKAETSIEVRVRGNVMKAGQGTPLLKGHVRCIRTLEQSDTDF